jgi:trk system potassium uptake protein TrkA
MNIMLIGGGRMGAEWAQLLNLRGDRVTVVDKDPEAFKRLGPAFRGRTVVGIGFDRDVLIQSGIEETEGLAAVTTSDEANLVVARMAVQIFRVPRVVARVYDPRKAEIYRRLGTQPIAPVAWGIHRIAEVLSFGNINATMSLGNGNVSLVEVEVPQTLAGRAINQLQVFGEMHVVAGSRGGDTFLPTMGTVLRAGDLLQLAVLGTSMVRLQELLALP